MLLDTPFGLTISQILLTITVLILIGYFFMINFIYFLSPNKKWESFPERCKIKTKCTRVADFNNRGYGLKPIEIKEDINYVQKKNYSYFKLKTSNENN